MTENELLADVIIRSKQMVLSTLADFSNVDMLARPCPAANHTAWQLGHLTESTYGLLGRINPSAAPPAGDRIYTKEKAAVADAAAYPPKEQLIADYTAAMDKAADVVKRCAPADFAKAIEGPVAARIPTVGHAASLLSNHTMMHVGQFQVIRRSLGKPVLF